MNKQLGKLYNVPEILKIERKKILDLYKEQEIFRDKKDSTLWYDYDVREAILTLLRELYGSKCLPDTPKFQIGEFVIVVTSVDHKGKIAQIEDVIPAHSGLESPFVYHLKNISGTFLEAYLASCPVTQPRAPRFQIGDKVVITKDCCDKGCICTVVEYDYSEPIDSYFYRFQPNEILGSWVEKYLAPYVEPKPDIKIYGIGTLLKQPSQLDITNNNNNMKERLDIGTHIKYNGEEFEIIGYDGPEGEYGYRVKCLNPIDDEPPTSIAYKAPFVILRPKCATEKDNFLLKLLKGHEGEKLFSFSVGEVVFNRIVGGEYIECYRENKKSRIAFHLDGKRDKHGWIDLYPSKELLRRYPLNGKQAWQIWGQEQEPNSVLRVSLGLGTIDDRNYRTENLNLLFNSQKAMESAVKEILTVIEKHKLVDKS